MKMVDVTITASSGKECPNCSKLVKRMAVEIEHAKQTLQEKVEDALKHNHNEWKHLDPKKPEHRMAQVMIQHIFDRLENLGMSWK